MFVIRDIEHVESERFKPLPFSNFSETFECEQFRMFGQSVTFWNAYISSGAHGSILMPAAGDGELKSAITSPTPIVSYWKSNLSVFQASKNSKKIEVELALPTRNVDRFPSIFHIQRRGLFDCSVSTCWCRSREDELHPMETAFVLIFEHKVLIKLFFGSDAK